MERRYLLAIDQGTTGTRSVVFDDELRPKGQAKVEVPPTFPAPGLVEHDPLRLIASVEATVAGALADAKIEAGELAALGIANQRETSIIWERATGAAIGPAIVWQDRRTADFCEANRARRAWVAERTGLVLDPYFSATKFAWLLDHVPNARRRAERGELAAGTVDSWLMRDLTGGERHVIDATNASRTALMDLSAATWADDLSRFFAVPREILPEIVPSAGILGETKGLGYLPDGLPIAGIAGDQQASLAGQGCLKAGDAKCTYGTGAFLLAHTGDRPIRSSRGLLTTRAAGLGTGPAHYALEGSVFVAGAAVQWFRDGLRAVGSASEVDRLALEAREDSEAIFVPALTGLGAPYWEPKARGALFGLSRGTSVADLARATLEGVAFQVADLIAAIQDDLESPLTELRVDGGMARSDPFLRFQADLLGMPIRRSPQTESTALGAALLAGLGVGLWPDESTAVGLLRQSTVVFEPTRDDAWRSEKLGRWKTAVEAVARFAEGPNL